MKNVGICGYGVSLPTRRLSVKETISNWENTSLELVVKNFGVYERIVLNSDEDTVTLSITSAKECLDNAKINIEKVDSLLLGSVTESELFRGSTNLIMEALSEKKEYFSSTVSSAENSGLSALFLAYAQVCSGFSEFSLVIGTDTLCRYTAPGDLRESYIGAGSASVLLGTNDTIADITGASSYNSNFPEMGRTEDERFIRSLMPVDSGIQKAGLVNHLVQAIKNFCIKYQLKLEDFDEIILPQQYPGEVLALSKILRLPKEKVEKAIYSDSTGDLGSASPLFALSKVLEIEKPNKKILVCGYGHNSSVNIVSLETTEKILSYQNNLKNSVEAVLRNKKSVSYAEAMKLEYKLIGPNISIGSFN